MACATAGHHVPWESLIAARVAELWGPRGVLLIKREAERRIPVEGAQWGRRGAGSAWLPARRSPGHEWVAAACERPRACRGLQDGGLSLGRAQLLSLLKGLLAGGWHRL